MAEIISVSIPRQVLDHINRQKWSKSTLFMRGYNLTAKGTSQEEILKKDLDAKNVICENQYRAISELNKIVAYLSAKTEGQTTKNVFKDEAEADNGNRHK